MADARGGEVIVLGAQEEIATRKLVLPRQAAPIWLLAALLGIATLVVYLPTLRNGFIGFDDPGYVTSNVRVQSGLSWKNAAWAFSTLEMENWQPLAWLSHMTDCQVFGLHPAGHHLTSIVLHALNGVLLFLLLYKATGFRWRSLMVAALFALHPLNVETVAWVAERKSLLSMLFSLVTIGLYGWYAGAPKWWKYLAVMAAFALALSSKPMAVTVPVVLLLLDYWPLGRLRKGAKGREVLRLVIEKAPLFAMSAAISWITIVAQRRGAAISSVAALPISRRLENAAISYVTYIRKMLWPNDLAYFYPLPSGQLALWEVSLAAVLLVSISVLVYRLRRRAVRFGWLFFVVTLVPVIGIVQVGRQSMADRYAYIPLIGLFIAGVWALADAAERLRIPPKILGALVLTPGILLSSCAMVTETYWRNDLALFSHAHDVTSKPNIEIEMNLAAALRDEGRGEEALAYLQNSEALAPKSFVIHYNVGYLLAAKGDHAGAVKEYQEALRLSHDPAMRAKTLNSLGIALLNLGDYRSAVQTFTEFLGMQPENAADLALRGHAFYSDRQYVPASRDFLKAAQITSDPELFLLAGKSLEDAGEAREAIEVYQTALNANPKNAEARERIAVLEKKKF